MNYKDYPKSLTEIKCVTMTEWTARDVLISLLREIDNGELQDIDCLSVVYRTIDGDSESSTGFRQMGPDSHTVIGLFEIAKHKMLSA